MLWLKGCPRCKKGDLVLGSDLYRSCRACVQCGYTDERLSEELPARVPALATREVAKRKAA